MTLWRAWGCCPARDDGMPRGAEGHLTMERKEAKEAKEALFEQFARIGKAMSSAKRLELVDLLVQGERSVESLARAAGMNLTTASAHLQALRQARLVTTRREGTKVFYRLAGPDVTALYLHVQRVAETHLADLAAARTAYLGPDDVEAVGRDEVVRRTREGTATLVDVRPAEEFASGHISGAVSIPLDSLAEHLADLPADLEVVVYCRGPHCVLSYDAVRLLARHGRSARRLPDNVAQWEAAQLPVEMPREMTAKTPMVTAEVA